MRIAIFIACVGLLGASQTFTGVITDTMCGAKHSMMKNQTDDQCVKMCAKESSDYALFDGKEVIKLSDQKTPEPLAAQHVRVTGSYDKKSKTIKVASMEADKGEAQ
jgi:hypothetical protein